MQDRLPLYPGRVKLIPVAGQENTYDMVRADQPTQEGTPLNKNSLLKDVTAALFGLGTDAVPDDVLQKIPSLFNDYKKIEVGQYIGTGSTSCSVTVNIEPILLIIYGFPQYDSSYSRYSYGLSIMPCGESVFSGRVSESKDTFVCFNRGVFIQTGATMIKGTSSKNIKWRYDGDNDPANEIAMNENSSIYYYICLGA